MTRHARRLDRLENHLSARIDEQRDAWLASLPDADVEALAEVAERGLAGDGLGDVPADLWDRYPELLAGWATWSPSPEGTP